MAACGGPPATPAAEEPRPSTTTTPAVAGTDGDLLGAWRVLEVRSPENAVEPAYHDAILLAGLKQVEVLSQCVTIGPFDYRRGGGGGIAVSLPQPRRAADGAFASPPPECARTLSPAEATLGPLLVAAERLSFNGNELTIIGRKGTLRARRPDGVLHNPFGNAPRPARPSPIGGWRVERVAGAPLGDRIHVVIRPGAIDWRSGCVYEARGRAEVRMDDITPGPLDAGTVCERAFSPAETALSQLLSGPVRIRWAPGPRLLLTGSGVSVIFVPWTAAARAEA